MKRFFLSVCSFIVIALALTSCHKEKTSDTATNNTYYIKCKIDGTAHTFTAHTMAHLTSFGAGMGSGLNLVAGASSTVTEGLNLGINFTSGAPAAGTYTEDDSGNDYVVAGVYNPGSTTIVFGAGTTYQSALPLSITISKMDSKELSGTFKGAFYKTNTSTGELSSEHVMLTEGEFRLPVTK